MKVKTIAALVLLAGAITFCEWAFVVGNDSFTPVDGHKVFIYGFPLSVPWYPREFEGQMPAWQILLRLLGNFIAALLGCGFLVWLGVCIRGRFQKDRSPNLT